VSLIFRATKSDVEHDGLGTRLARFHYGSHSVLKAFFGSVTLALAAAMATGCSGGHGFLGTDFLPKGDITITDFASGAPITSSVGSPFVNRKSGFTIGIAETNFDGPYTVAITAWNNGFNKPCFVPHQINPQNHVNAVLFSADNANAPGGAPTAPNPCVSDRSDEETVLISDGKGHSQNFYFIY